MKNILFLENSFGNSYGYYQEIISGFSKATEGKCDVYVFRNFSPESSNRLNYNIQPLLDNFKEQGKPISAVVFGFGWTNCGSFAPNNFSLEDDIEKYVILNKEYTALEEKLEWIKESNFNAAFTVHHDFKEYENITNTKFYHLPFAANPELFKNYNEEFNYEYDFGFTGIIRPEQTENWRYKVHSTLKDTDIWGDTRIYFTDHHHDSLTDYAKRICTSKIWFSTTGPADLVGTRYYEVMLTGTTLLACNRFDYLGLFEEDKHCIMFDTVEELAEKVKFYSDPTNEEKRMEIVKNAYDLSINNHNWKARGRIMSQAMEIE